MQVLACGDVIPECSVVIEGDTDDELLRKVADHAETSHGITEISDDVMDAVRAAIRRT